VVEGEERVTSLAEGGERGLEEHGGEEGVVVDGLAVEEAHQLGADVEVVQLHRLHDEQGQLAAEVALVLDVAHRTLDTRAHAHTEHETHDTHDMRHTTHDTYFSWFMTATLASSVTR
jgi:hypothetical protein